MIQLSGAGKRFGHKLLFENVDWLITPNDHIGLVGGNGTGKSTLMKILAGMDTLDYGTLTLAKGIRRIPATGWTYALRAQRFCRVHVGVRRSARYGNGAGNTDAQHGGARSHQRRIFRLLPTAITSSSTNFARATAMPSKPKWAGADRPGFSQRRLAPPDGGILRRLADALALAKLLLQKPNLLLLDEPTNHLDLEARNWLEEYLTHYPFAFILISHDRYFLDVTVNKIAEIWNKRVHFYTGNYDKYLSAEDAAQRAAGSRLPQPARPNRAAGGVYQPLPLPGDQSQAGAEPHQGTGKNRAHRDAAGRKDHSLLVSRSPSQSGRIVAEFKGVAKTLWRTKQCFRAT